MNTRQPEHVHADRFTADGDKDGADAALYAADRAQKHCKNADAMLDAMEAAEAQYDAQKKPGARHTPPLTVPQIARQSASHALSAGYFSHTTPERRVADVLRDATACHIGLTVC